MKNLAHGQSGLTLIELLVALSIIAITMTLAHGAFPVIEKYRTENTARELVGAIMFSRSLAITEGESVYVCPSKDGLSCDKSWSQQILIYHNRDDDKSFTSNDELLRIYDTPNSNNIIKWSAFKNKHYLELLPSGMTNYQNGTFTVCAKSKELKHAIPVIVNVAGRPYFGLDKNNDGIREYSNGNDVSCS